MEGCSFGQRCGHGRAGGSSAVGLGFAAGLLVGSQLLAVVTGLASSEAEPAGLMRVLVLAMIGGYSLALIVIGVGGALLLRDLFKR